MIHKIQESARGARAVTAAFIGIALLLNVGILLGDGVPVHGDLTYPWRIENYTNLYLYLFNDAGSISNFESVDRIFLIVPALLADLLNHQGLVHKIIFFALPLVSLISMAALLRFALRRVNHEYIRPGVIIPASLLFAFSPWVIEQVQAYLFWLAYALTPVLILLTFQLFERPTVVRAIALALALVFVASTPHYLAYSLLIMAVVGTTEFVHQVRQRDNLREVVSTLALPLLTLLLATLVLNFSWIYPTIQILLAGGSVGPGYTVDRASTELFSTQSGLFNVARGYDQWIYWYRRDPSLGIVFTRPYVLVTLLPPLLTLVAAISREGRRSRHFLVLGGLGLVFGILALGTNTPILEWLIFDAPLLGSVGWIFRVPGKLSYLLWPAYCLGFALILGRLLANARVLKRVGVYTAVALGIGILILPKTFVYFYHYYVPVPQPSEYAQLERFMEGQPNGTRVLYMAPYDGAFGRNQLKYETSFTWNPTRVATATPVISSARPAIDYYHLTYRDWQNPLYPLIYPTLPENIGLNYLSRASVRFLVYHNDIVSGEARGRSDLRKLARTDLKHVASFGFIHVFENPFVLPTIRTASWRAPADNIRVQKRDPATYHVDLGDTEGTHPLYMSQPYDPLWVLRVGDTTVAPSKVGPVTMKFTFPSGDVREGTIEYLPQRFYRQGLAVSIVGLGLISLVLLLARRGRVRSVDRISSAHFSRPGEGGPR